MRDLRTVGEFFKLIFYRTYIFAMNYSVTDADIRSYLGPIQIIKYEKIRKYSDISQMLGTSGVVVILYMTEKNYGHWTCLFRGKDGINFFDSYGKQIDEPLRTRSVKKQPGQDFTHLTALLAASPEPVQYNNFKFQELNPAVTTCGRHVILRLMNRDKTADEYKRFLDSQSRGYKKLANSPDSLGGTQYDYFVIEAIF